MNKKQESIYATYLKSSARELSDVYKNWSGAKEVAMRSCRDLCASLHGYNLRILSHNSQFFSVGFMYLDRPAGALMFMYITAYKKESWVIQEDAVKPYKYKVGDKVQLRAGRGASTRLKEHDGEIVTIADYCSYTWAYRLEEYPDGYWREDCFRTVK